MNQLKAVPEEKIDESDMPLLLIVLEHQKAATQLGKEAHAATQVAIKAEGVAMGAEQVFLQLIRSKLGIEGEFKIDIVGRILRPGNEKG